MANSTPDERTSVSYDRKITRLRDCWACGASMNFDQQPSQCTACGADDPCGDGPNKQAFPTSNPSAAELIEQARKWPRDSHGEGRWFNAMADEIERLTRGMNAQADVMVAREREFAAALKRLDELERANLGLATESERRRAALETAQKQLGTLAALILQDDREGAKDWARGVVIVVGKDGEPLVALSGEPGSAVETSGKPVPCWCPYCGEPHGVRRAETDPRGTECQHDRFKPRFTLQWLGSTPDIRANTHRFQCRICRETFDLAIGEAQLGAQKATPELAPVYQRKCARCGKMAASATPEGVGVYYCSIECAD